MTGSNDMHTCPKCGQPLRPTALFCPDCGTAVLSSVSNALQISIEQMLATMKPGQAEVLRRCAIPRWFDDEILSVLRERNNDAQNQKILDQLKTYSFVRELGDGRYSYSEDVRNYLLDDWRKRPDDLRPIQKRLYNYFDARMGSTNLENRASWKREVVTYDLLLASTTAVKDQQNTNEDNMWIMTRSTVDARVDRALLKFRAAFEEAFNAHRMAEAEALLVAAEEQINILAPRICNWLIYYRGKMNFTNLKLDQAQNNYQLLIEQSDVEPELQVLTALNLGDAQVEASSWAAAIQSYQQALANPKITSSQIADAHLGIADVYNEIAINSGGWLIPKVEKNAFLRVLRSIFEWFLRLPMLVLVSTLRRLGAEVPPAYILSRYQNWLLARILRASRDEVEQAYKIFTERNDPWNKARCQMRLIEIDLLFDKLKPAVAMAERLLDDTANEDSYRRARVAVTVARAFAADKQYQRAEELAKNALAVFQAVDDGRWEARTQTMLGRMALDQGQSDQALNAFEHGLERARSIGSILGRERLLYELRAWRRQSINYPPVIDTILDEEPAQRFVNRFPRFLLPYLQFGQMALVPIMLILAAVIAPQVGKLTYIITPSNFLLPAATDYTFPWYRMIVSPLIMILIATLAYALLGLIVLWRMPLSMIQQNQPDLIIMRPNYVLHYDEKGNKAHEIAWKDVTTITSSNRALWKTPMPAFSRMVLHGEDQRLTIDGVVSWYNAARAQVIRRVKAAGAQFTYHNFDLSLLRSSIGGLVITGALLLAIMILDANGLLGLSRILPATLYATVQLIAYSGILVIVPVMYWMIIRPLRQQREFDGTRVPQILAIIGLVTVALFLITNGSIVQMPIFSIALFLSGLVLLAEASYHLISRRNPSSKQIRALQLLYGAVLLVGLLMVATPIRREFYHARSAIYAAQGNSAAATRDRFRELAQKSRFFSPPMDLVQATWYSENARWSEAERAYDAIINNPDQDPLTLAMTYHNLSTTKLEACRNQTCPPEQFAQIETWEDRAVSSLEEAKQFADINVPAMQSAMLESQANLYVELNQPVIARTKLEQAKLLTPDRTAQDRIQQTLDRLPK